MARPGLNAVLPMLLVGAFAWAACGDGSAGSDSGGSDPDSQAVDVSAAKAAVADYSGEPSAFPVDKPLERPPAGSRFAFLQNSTPVAALAAAIHTQPSLAISGSCRPIAAPRASSSTCACART